MSGHVHRRLADSIAVLSLVLLAAAGALTLTAAPGAALDGLLAGTAVVLGFGPSEQWAGCSGADCR